MTEIREWREPFDGTVGDLARAVQAIVDSGVPPRGVVNVVVSIGPQTPGSTGLRGEIIVRSDGVIPDEGIPAPAATPDADIVREPA